MVDNGLPLDKDEAYGVLKTIIREKGSNYGKHFNVLTQVVLGHEDPMLVALGMITYHNVKMALLRPYAETIDTLIYLKEPRLSFSSHIKWNHYQTMGKISKT